MFDFQPPDYLEDEYTPQTQTDALIERIEEIESVLLNGNTWRYVNGGSAAIALGVATLGGGILSPLSTLVLLSSSVAGAISYASYILWEGKELNIKVSPLPLSSGEKEEIKDLLPTQDKAHYRLVQWYGQDAVNWIESQGCLDEVIRHSMAIKGTTGAEAQAYAEKLKAAIADHYLATYPYKNKPSLPPALPKAAIAPQPNQVKLDPPRDAFSAWMRTSRLDKGQPIYDQHGAAYVPSQDGQGFVPLTQPPVTPAPITEDLEPDDNWEIPQSRKKQQRAVPIEDIAHNVANFDKDTESHWCFVAPPRVGKSTLLLSAIAKMSGDVYLVDCKGDDTRLRNSKKLNPGVKYLHVNDGDKIDKLFQLLEYLEGEIIYRQSGGEKTPITLIVDELNQLKITMSVHESRTKSKGLYTFFCSILLKLIGQGLSSKIKVVFSTHSLRVEDLPGNGAMLHQLSVIGLGKGDRIASLKDVITYKIDEDDKSRIRADMLAAIGQNPSEVIAILVYGIPRVISLPYVDYSHLEIEGAKPVKPALNMPAFDEPEPEVPSFTANDLLTYLEKREGRQFTPRELAMNLKVPTEQILIAADGLIQSEAEGVEVVNWRRNGAAIGYFKTQGNSNYPNNVVPFAGVGLGA